MVLAAAGIISAAEEEARFLSDFNIQAFAASGTWTKPSGATWVLIEICAGGSHGGAAGVTGAAQSAIGDGGGGGEYARVLVAASLLTATVAVTVGLGATAGSALAGGTSSFGAYLTAIGGSPGSARAASSTLHYSSAALGRIGGTGGAGLLTADLRVPGGAGGSGFYFDATSAANVRGGDGGSSYWCGTTAAPDGHQIGQNGRTPGGGGSGAANSASQALRLGGNGGNGRVLVTTWI